MQSNKRRRLERVVITGISLAGIVVLLFPTIANWFSSLGFTEQKGSYETAARALSAEERDSIIDSAREYNTHLPQGPLRDPYLIADDGDIVDLRAGMDEYLDQLDFGDGLMGWVEFPRIDIAVPIYHGTDQETLDKGAGHLLGSALPVGGPSSHAVITAHSGRINANLFTDLDKAKVGDVFFTEVVGERFYYKVDHIEVVKPVYSGEKLRQMQGKDYVTLLTCTPTGVNSHRLLVRGVRIPDPEGSRKPGQIAAADYVADFPWWIPAVIGVPTVMWALLGLTWRRPRNRRRRTFKEAHESV